MAHHEPFKALGPLPWEAILGDSDDDRNTVLADLLKTTFASAQVLIDSIPGESSSSSSNKKKIAVAATTRARSQTDSAVAPPNITQTTATTTTPDPNIALLQKEWKEVKTSPKDNPLNIAVHKLSARDGNGSWFARRSVHRGVPFEKWVLGLRREFAETSALRSGATDGKSVRGLGAERRVARVSVPRVGTAEVFLVSVRFPGPTTPRDFVAVLLMPDEAETTGKGKVKGTRQFMLVSRPCEHPECPTRQGFIRGTYESVEFVREVPVEKPLRRTRSSNDMRNGEVLIANGVDDGECLNKEAVLRAALAGRAVADGAAKAVAFTDSLQAKTAASSPGPSGDEDEEADTAIEWLMVTRSDPGGSVPRFMVEKGTPGGIINDAGRFLTWVTQKSEEELRAAMDAGVDELDEPEANSPDEKKPDTNGRQPSFKATVRSPTDEATETASQDIAPPTGFYGMIASALEAAGSVVISRMSSLAGSARSESDLDDELDSESDTASELSYRSAEEGDSLSQPALNDIKDSPSIPDIASSARSVRSTLSSGSQAVPAPDPHNNKELRRLQERRQRAHDKMTKAQERLVAKRRDNDSDKAQEAALVKLREKHEREMAKQEEKFQRDLLRLQEKRAAERRKAEDRRRKAEEREDRRNLQAELEKTRAERDMALREIEILKEQVGALQSQNTMLVATLGKDVSAVNLGK